MGDIRPNDWLQLSPSLAILLAGQAEKIVEAAKWWRPSASWSGGEGWMGDWWAWEEMVSWATDQREPLLLTAGWWVRELISREKKMGKCLWLLNMDWFFKYIYLFICVYLFIWLHQSFPGNTSGKESACDAGDLSLNSGLGRSLGGGHSNPLKYSCLENSIDRGSWQDHGVAKSHTGLSN